jgi:hypothetical protein
MAAAVGPQDGVFQLRRNAEFPTGLHESLGIRPPPEQTAEQGEYLHRPDMPWPDCRKPCREFVASIPLLLVGMVLQPTMAFTGQPIALSRAARGIGLCAFDPFVFHGRVEVVVPERGTV